MGAVTAAEHLAALRARVDAVDARARALAGRLTAADRLRRPAPDRGVWPTVSSTSSRPGRRTTRGSRSSSSTKPCSSARASCPCRRLRSRTSSMASVRRRSAGPCTSCGGHKHQGDRRGKAAADGEKREKHAISPERITSRHRRRAVLSHSIRAASFGRDLAVTCLPTATSRGFHRS